MYLQRHRETETERKRKRKIGSRRVEGSEERLKEWKNGGGNGKERSGIRETDEKKKRLEDRAESRGYR